MPMPDRKQKFSDLPAAAQAGITLGGVLQVAFAVLAFIDLARRPGGRVRGPKPVWIPVILVNWLGPAAYFAFGRRRADRSRAPRP